MSNSDEEPQEDYGELDFNDRLWIVKVALDEAVQVNSGSVDDRETRLHTLAIDLREFYHFMMFRRPPEVPWTPQEMELVNTFFRYLRPAIEGREDPRGFEGIRGLHDRFRSEIRCVVPEVSIPRSSNEEAYRSLQ